MKARTVALVFAALAGLATLGWKSVPTHESLLSAAQISGPENLAWDGFRDFCVGLHRELSVAEVQTDDSRVRGYIVARALDDLCGRESPAYSTEKTTN